MTRAALLPAEFDDLENYAVKWAKATEDERWEVRLNSTFDEVRDFYETFFPRVEAALKHCDQFPVDAMPEEAKNLTYLLCALNTASFAVECWGQNKVPDTGAAKVDCIVQPLL